MARPKTIEEAKYLCSGCRDDRYNHKGLCERPGIDAPVTSDKCWSLELDKPVYNRSVRRWVMPCHSDLVESQLAHEAIEKEKRRLEGMSLDWR